MKSTLTQGGDPSNSSKDKKVASTLHSKKRKSKLVKTVFSSCHRTTSGTVLFLCKDEQGKSCLALEFKTTMNERKEIVFPTNLLNDKKKLRALLSDTGYPLWLLDDDVGDIQALSKEIATVGDLFQTNGFHSAHGKTYFVLGKKVFPNSQTALSICDYSDWIEAKGRSEKQKDLLEKLSGSSPAIMAVGMAFLAPLIKLLDAESFGLLFFGRSSSGKSKLLYLAASIYGYRQKLSTWFATDNALQEEAERNNDLITLLDEGRTCESDPERVAKRIGRLAYALTSGVSKQRSKTYIDLNQQKKQWNTLLLCTNEHSLRELSSISGTKQDAGETLRIIDVPVDYGDTSEGGRKGIFRTLPDGQQSGANLVRELEKSVIANHGQLGRKYVRFLTQKINDGKEDLLKRKLEAYANDFLSDIQIKGQGGYAERLGRRFGLIYAALKFAAEQKFVPWSERLILDSVSEMYQRTLDYASNPKDLMEQGIRALVNCLSDDRRVFSIQSKTALEDVQTAYNENKVFKHDDRYFFPSKKLIKIFGSEGKANAALNALQDCILNEKGADGWPAETILSATGKNSRFRKRCIVFGRTKLLERLGLN